MTEQVLALGGEGETPGAINLNNLVATRRSVEAIRRDAKPLVVGDMTQLPFADGVFDKVIGRDVPGQNFGDFRDRVCSEAFRVLKSGGTIEIGSLTGGGGAWAPHLRSAGFVGVRMGGMALGQKP